MQGSVVALVLIASIAPTTEALYSVREFDSATKEIPQQVYTVEEPILVGTSQKWQDERLTELGTDGKLSQMLLAEKGHNVAVKASYQSNVKTIYYHLEQIIEKILAHKQTWTTKYTGDLDLIANEVLTQKNMAEAAEKKYIKTKGKAAATKKYADTKSKSWQKAKEKLKQKINDVKKVKNELKGLYQKGLKQKAGEICMIRKIQCMVAKFNHETNLREKYCSACTDDEKADKQAKLLERRMLQRRRLLQRRKLLHRRRLQLRRKLLLQKKLPQKEADTSRNSGLTPN
jgi:hypothetical protein